MRSIKPRLPLLACALLGATWACAPVAPQAAAQPTGTPAASSGTPASSAPANAPAAPGATPAPPAEAAAAPMADPKFDVEALLARERAPLPTLGVVDPEGRWRATIEGRREPLVVKRDDHVSVRTNFGSKYELRCEVHDGQLNPGALVANLLAAASGTISLEDVTPYRVSHAAHAPVLAVRARYSTLATPPAAGELKVAVSPGTQFTIVCLHDEPGYHEAFARIVEGFVGSFESAAPDRKPQYSAIWRQQVGETNTGYSWERIYADADGAISSFTFGVTIAQLASGELRVRDEVAAEVHDHEGIRRANFLSFRGTSRVHELSIERGAKGAYTYRGALDGKPLEGQLTPRTPLASQYELLLQLKKVLSGTAPASFRRDEYRPLQDPRQPASVDYVFDATAQTLTRKIGTQSDLFTLKDGQLATSRVQQGPNLFLGTLIDRQDALGSEPGVTVGMQPTPPAGAPLPLAERRKNFETRVFAETDHTPAKQPPAGVLNKVTYAAPLGANVAYVTPPKPGKKQPAVIWIGGGLDWGIGEVAWTKAPRDNDRSARAFREAGLTLMLPALRGSNENPGKNECFLGEVEDVLAAADYLAARADVDPARIYLVGHATGGTLALLAAASSERFRAVFALGPVSDARQYGTPAGGGCLPVDAAAEEQALRAPVQFVNTIRTPTYVFEGGVGGNSDVFDDLRERASRSVFFTVTPGLDANGLLAPATEAIARAIARDRVDEVSLTIGAGRTTRAPQ